MCLILAVSLAVSLPGCGLLQLPEEEEQAEATPPVILEGTGQEIADTYRADHIFSINSVEGESFNPYSTNSLWNMVAGMLAYEPLVKTDNAFEAHPYLLTNWSTEDGRVWTFWVDITRKFHDGGSLTAYDAAYSLNQAINAYDGRYKTRFSHVTAVDVIDSQTFNVTLDMPNRRFYELMNIPCIESGSIYSSMPAGTGPYMFNEAGTAMTRFADYPDADELPLRTIYLKKYRAAEDILQAFEDSLLDLVVNNPSDMGSLGFSRANIIKYVETTNLHFLGYNINSRLFSQSYYRAMITYAVDRDSIVSSCMQGSGVAATLPIHPNSPLYPKNIAGTLEYSMEDLATVMTNLGATDVDYDGNIEFGGAVAEINFLVCTDSSAKVSAARQIATQLRSAGFVVNMLELGYDDYMETLRSGGYDIYYGEVKLCNDWDLTELFTTAGTANTANFRDPTLVNYVQAFLASGDDTREENRDALYQYMAQNAPITPICFERSQVLYHRGVLATINPTQENIFNDMTSWTVSLD